MISLIPAVAGRRSDVTMSQQISQDTQERINELIRRTQEKGERKKKRKGLKAGKATMSSSSQEHPSDPVKGQETTIATSEVANQGKKRKWMLKNRKKQQPSKIVNPP